MGYLDNLSATLLKLDHDIKTLKDEIGMPAQSTSAHMTKERLVEFKQQIHSLKERLARIIKDAEVQSQRLPQEQKSADEAISQLQKKYQEINSQYISLGELKKFVMNHDFKSLLSDNNITNRLLDLLPEDKKNVWQRIIQNEIKSRSWGVAWLSKRIGQWVYGKVNYKPQLQEDIESALKSLKRTRESVYDKKREAVALFDVISAAITRDKDVAKDTESCRRQLDECEAHVVAYDAKRQAAKQEAQKYKEIVKQQQEFAQYQAISVHVVRQQEDRKKQTEPKAPSENIEAKKIRPLRKSSVSTQPVKVNRSQQSALVSEEKSSTNDGQFGFEYYMKLFKHQKTMKAIVDSFKRHHEKSKQAPLGELNLLNVVFSRLLSLYKDGCDTSDIAIVINAFEECMATLVTNKVDAPKEIHSSLLSILNCITEFDIALSEKVILSINQLIRFDLVMHTQDANMVCREVRRCAYLGIDVKKSIETLVNDQSNQWHDGFLTRCHFGELSYLLLSCFMHDATGALDDKGKVSVEVILRLFQAAEERYESSRLNELSAYCFASDKDKRACGELNINRYLSYILQAAAYYKYQFNRITVDDGVSPYTSGDVHVSRAQNRLFLYLKDCFELYQNVTVEQEKEIQLGQFKVSPDILISVQSSHKTYHFAVEYDGLHVHFYNNSQFERQLDHSKRQYLAKDVLFKKYHIEVVRFNYMDKHNGLRVSPFVNRITNLARACVVDESKSVEYAYASMQTLPFFFQPFIEVSPEPAMIQQSPLRSPSQSS